MEDGTLLKNQMSEKDKKAMEIQPEEPKTLTSKQERFCELVASGLSPQEAYLASGYSPGGISSSPYILQKKQGIKERIAALIDKSLPRIVKNDVELAKLKVHKGEHVLENGKEIPPSLIEGAKNRIYDRSSLGPVIRQIKSDVTVGVNITPQERQEAEQTLARYYNSDRYKKMGNPNDPMARYIQSKYPIGSNERNEPIDITPKS